MGKKTGTYVSSTHSLDYFILHQACLVVRGDIIRLLGVIRRLCITWLLYSIRRTRLVTILWWRGVTMLLCTTGTVGDDNAGRRLVATSSWLDDYSSRCFLK